MASMKPLQNSERLSGSPCEQFFVGRLIYLNSSFEILCLHVYENDCVTWSNSDQVADLMFVLQRFAAQTAMKGGSSAIYIR